MVWVIVILSQVAAYLIADAIVEEKPKQPTYEFQNFRITPECHRDEKDRLICPKIKA